MDGVAIDGVRCGSAQALVLKWPLVEIEHHEDPSEVKVPGVVLVSVALLKTLDISVSHVIHEIDLSSAQGSQAHRVLFFGLANNLIKVGQLMAFGIGFPVILETHHPGLTPACPGDKFERA